MFGKSYEKQHYNITNEPTLLCSHELHGNTVKCTVAPRKKKLTQSKQSLTNTVWLQTKDPDSNQEQTEDLRIIAWSTERRCFL